MQGYTNFLTLPQFLQRYTNLLNFTTVFAGFHKSVKLYHIVYNLQIFSTLIGQKSRKNELKRYNMIFISFLYSKGVSFGDQRIVGEGEGVHSCLVIGKEPGELRALMRSAGQLRPFSLV